MVDPLLRWRGKVALVTGASSGIGRAVALDLAALGLKVALSGRRPDALETAAAEARATGADTLVLPGDLSSPAGAANLFAIVRERWGGVDILVNCAGLRGGASLLGTPWPEMEQALNVNVLAALACMREAVADMRHRADAAIVNISSMTGHRVLPGVPALYAATKHALRVLTDGLRSELAAEKLPIKVALISPGLVDTPWHYLPDGIVTKKGGYPYAPLQSGDIAAAVRYILSAPPHVQITDILLRPTAQPF